MINTVFYPYYAHLNPVGRKLYEQLLPGYQAHKEKIPVSVPARFEDAAPVITAICNDHPEIFWMSQKAQVFYNSSTVQVTGVNPNYICAVSRIPRMQQAFQAAVQKYLAAAAGKTPLEQERILHDKMVNDISYVSGPNDQTAYGALVEGKAVCAGYTRAFQLLMQKVGIPCYYCHGDAKGNGETKWGPHAWNILKLANDYYNMDLTWDDCYDKTDPGKISYTYYNCDDRQILSNHRRSQDCKFLPSCKGSRFTFQGLTGKTPKLEEIHQTGVTCSQVIRSIQDFRKYVLPVVQKSAGKATKVSFPVEGEQNYLRLKKEVSDMLKEKLADYIFHIEFLYTDFHDGWHRFEITISYEDPLKKIYQDGVTCRQIIHSRSDFDRHILPAIRRNAGKTTTVAFPLESRGNFDPLRKSLDESIRNAVKGKSYRWNTSWTNYCGNWYRLQIRIEYKR